MISPRALVSAATRVAAILVAASCATTSPSPVSTAPLAPPPQVSPPPIEIAEAPTPPRPLPPLVATPMSGEPAGASLAEAHLVGSSCEDDRTRTDALVAKMREDVDASFERWRKDQPGCWAEYRRQAEEEKLRAQGWGVGGGGRGLAGIGLGSIGTIGHGSGSAAPRQAKSASGTNNQVAGVDEGDIVKNDGRYVYIASNGALRILEAMSPRVVSVTKLAGDVRELFVEGDRAVVYTSSSAHAKACTYGYDCVFAGDGTSTRITVLDVATRAAPKVVRELELSGSLMASRRIGKTVHTVVADGDVTNRPLVSVWPAGLDTCGTLEASVRAKFAALKVDNERKIRKSVGYPTLRERGVTTELCHGLYRTAFDDGRAFTTVVSFSLDDDRTAPKTATLQSRPGAVFASTDALYFSVAHRKAASNGRWYSFYPSTEEVSDLHKFKIGATPEATRYLGSGVVPGHVLNQFAMDEWAGYLRVATTKGRVPSPDVESAVSIFAEGTSHDLVRVGAVEKIAPGEDIRAVRFDGDRGYVVTFKKTDPLFVVDLYDAARPKVLGELKIPGFSTYMHRLDPDHLLSIGFDANDHGDFAYFDGVILQLFDVKTPTEPKLLFKEKIGSRGTSSEAATNHLAFNYFADKGLLAIPMTICEGGSDGVYGRDLTFSGLLVYDVSVTKGFKKLGGVDHGTKGASCSAWWSHASSVVQRSIFLDDLVYSIAGDRVKVQRMGRFGDDVADISLLP